MQVKEGISQQQMAERRREKIQELRNKGINPYPVSFPDRQTISDAKKSIYSKVAGRVVGKRDLGEIVFLDIEDQTGKIEIHSKHTEICDYISLGDLIGTKGVVSENRRGDKIVRSSILTILAKAIRDPPDKTHGVQDPESRFRHREVEMLSDPNTRELFIMRSEVIQSIRKFLIEKGFIEVETPVLQPVYGGATARPFVTSHNALNKTSYLRISSELYLKRYMVGGLDKVFHIGKSFRNEGISTEHSPEFTMVEFFQSCVDDSYMHSFTESLMRHICLEFDYNRYEIFTDHKLDASDWPLSRKNEVDSSKSLAWEMYIDDMEIASGASDLNDPDEQKERLLEGSAVKVDDFEEANPYDQSYIESLEYGLLPIAGVGIGIDRLMMLLTGKKNIREVIAFPAMR